MLCTMGCETRSPLYLIGDAASLRGLCTGKVFHPAQRPGPLNGHPPSYVLDEDDKKLFQSEFGHN